MSVCSFIHSFLYSPLGWARFVSQWDSQNARFLCEWSKKTMAKRASWSNLFGIFSGNRFFLSKTGERGLDRLVFVSNLKREISNIFNPTEQLCCALKYWFRINELFNLKDDYRTQVHMALGAKTSMRAVSIDLFRCSSQRVRASCWANCRHQRYFETLFAVVTVSVRAVGDGGHVNINRSVTSDAYHLKSR